MGLKNTHDSTIKDLKATFFDLFSEHTEELVGMIQLLATDSTVDVMKIESLIFQRIVMLNNAALNVKNVVTDIDYLSAVKGVGAKGKRKKEEDVSEKDDLDALRVHASPPTIPAPTTVPVAAAMPTTTAPVAMPTTAPVAMPTTAPVVTTPPVPVTAAPTMPTTAPVAMPTTVPMATTAPVAAPEVQKQSTPGTPMQRKTLSEVISERAKSAPQAQPPAKKLRFVKTSDAKVKAILVNDKQYQKLRNSLVIQTKLLDFGISTGPEPSREKIEALMKKASALYKEGKVSEAQALYAEISNLNKQLKKTDTKVLSKVA